MKNTINYYYNVNINNLIKTNDYYYFYINKTRYNFVRYNRPIGDVEALYKLNYDMLQNGCIVNQIILNKDSSPITIINNIPFVLLKINHITQNDNIINDIFYIQNHTYNINFDKILLRDDWIKLWTEKIDYYEYQISQLGKKYPILYNSLSYFIGIGENAISYLINNQSKSTKRLVVSHRRIDMSENISEFYNPLNFIIDCRSRDIAEYIKNAFFFGNIRFGEINLYFDYINFTKEEYINLFSRLLFPTYYFDIYDEIINNNKNENEIIPILEKTNEYEKFLVAIYEYIKNKKQVSIEPVEWLFKSYS